MAISVYGWRKPTLTLELVEGGTLLANTTYYVLGYMRSVLGVYANVSGPVSDIYTITTTSTARSIKITQKTYRDITAFANGGTNITIVTCARHCLKTGDSIKIASGSYTGIWTVTKVDANTFTIPTYYIDNAAVQCYTDSVNYNNSNFGMMYWIHTVNPSTISNLQVDGHWSDNEWTNTNGTVNPITITAPLTRVHYNNNNLETGGFNKGLFAPVASYGAIWIDIDSLVTLQNIYDAVQTSGFIYNCFYIPAAGYLGQAFFLVGSARFIGSGSLSVDGGNINIICGEFGNKDNDKTKLNLNRVIFNTVIGTYQGMFNGTLNNSLFYGGPALTDMIHYFAGSNQTLYATPFPNNSIGGNNDGVETYNNFVYGVITDKTFQATIATGQKQTWNNNCIYRNCKWIGVNEYWGFRGSWGDTTADCYMMENCYMSLPSSKDYHYLFYDTPSTRVNAIKFLNVNTEIYDNRKRSAHSVKFNLTAQWYRRVKFNIKNQAGTAIQDVSIKITDSVNNVYTGSTDINGYVFIDCLEQKHQFVEADSASGAYFAAGDTTYIGFTITITKSGYDTEIIKLAQLYQTGMFDAVFNISLHSEPQITGVAITDSSKPNTNDGSIQITATNGTGPYQYSLDGTIWQSGSTFSGLAAGTYTVYVKDANNNTDSMAGVHVAQPPYESMPVITGINTVNCSVIGGNDGSITITGTGTNTPVTFSIDGVHYYQSGVFAALVKGVYSAYVKDSRGNVTCVDGVTITEPSIDVTYAAPLTGTVDEEVISGEIEDVITGVFNE